MLGGEKKKHRKESIAVKRRERMLLRGVDLEEINLVRKSSCKEVYVHLSLFYNFSLFLSLTLWFKVRQIWIVQIVCLHLILKGLMTSLHWIVETRASCFGRKRGIFFSTNASPGLFSGKEFLCLLRTFNFFSLSISWTSACLMAWMTA